MPHLLLSRCCYDDMKIVQTSMDLLTSLHHFLSTKRPNFAQDTAKVCTPTMDIRAEDTYSTWKRSIFQNTGGGDGTGLGWHGIQCDVSRQGMCRLVMLFSFVMLLFLMIKEVLLKPLREVVGNDMWKTQSDSDGHDVIWIWVKAKWGIRSSKKIRFPSSMVFQMARSFPSMAESWICIPKVGIMSSFGGWFAKGSKKPRFTPKTVLWSSTQTSHATVSFRCFFPGFLRIMRGSGWTKHPRVVDPTFFLNAASHNIPIHY